MWRLMSLLSLHWWLIEESSKVQCSWQTSCAADLFFKVLSCLVCFGFLFQFYFSKSFKHALFFLILSNMEYLFPLCFKFMLLFFSAQWWCYSLWLVLNNSGLTLVCVCMSPENGRMFEGCVFCQQAKWGWREMSWYVYRRCFCNMNVLICPLFHLVFSKCAFVCVTLMNMFASQVWSTISPSVWPTSPGRGPL